MLKKILITLVVILLISTGVYYFFLYTKSNPAPQEGTTDSSGIFTPINRSSVVPSTTSGTSSTSTQSSSSFDAPQAAPLSLRQISTAPVGGFMASTTASSTLVRYIDRGIGHVFEALNTTNTISKISNTTIPKIYESYWNKNANAGVLRYIKEGTDNVVNFYAEIRPVKTSTTSDSNASDFIPYEIKGKFLSADIKEVAVSPKRDRIFTWNIENGKGVGYISGFDENKKTRILELPLTQVSIDWPEENTLAIATKPSAVSSGYLYLFDIKKATLTKVLGGITGLITKVSSDAKKVIFSTTRPGGNSVTTSIYNLKDNTSQETVFKTLPDKCVWSRLHPLEAYCAVPTRFDAGMYPDDWYKGNVSFIDQIWHLDTATGEVHLMANLLNLSNNLIDATDLTLDPKENFLLFTNKRDLTLWSLDLNQ